MSVRDTVGVRGLARVLVRLSDGAPVSVAQLAQAEGLARSTAFDLVKRLEAARLAAREPNGGLTAGPAAIALAFSRFGLARLHGPAAALLAWLCDHSGASATLTCAGEGEGERVVLASCAAGRGRPAATSGAASLSHAICGDGGLEVARLDVICRSDPTAIERAEIESLALRVKATLERRLADAPAEP